MVAGDLESSRMIGSIADVSWQTGCSQDLEWKTAHEELEGFRSYSL